MYVHCTSMLDVYNTVLITYSCFIFIRVFKLLVLYLCGVHVASKITELFCRREFMLLVLVKAFREV